MEQVVFFSVLIVALGGLYYSFRRIKAHFSITRSMAFDWKVRERLMVTMRVVMGQTKILRKPVVGLLHALVFWGFLVITLGSLEMVIDGLTGQHRILARLGWFYNVISASGDVFAYIVLIGVLAFLIRRRLMDIRRFSGVEIGKTNKKDANIALVFIVLLMVSLIGMNAYDILAHQNSLPGYYPITSLLLYVVDPHGGAYHQYYSLFWWLHIILIFVFANYLPYSKHFHVFMSLPNVFFSKLKPLGFLPFMPEVNKEVRLMLGKNDTAEDAGNSPSRFGVKDVEDVTWKNYMDALTCTQCGRCIEVCPANITGKLLSPRKIFVDLRQRMKVKGDVNADTGKTLVGGYITTEELWACTTCNACAQECPLNISHPNLIVDMRRYLVLEEGCAPEELNVMFANIENNGAPWKYAADDRLKWTVG